MRLVYQLSKPLCFYFEATLVPLPPRLRPAVRSLPRLVQPSYGADTLRSGAERREAEQRGPTWQQSCPDRSPVPTAAGGQPVHQLHWTFTALLLDTSHEGQSSSDLGPATLRSLRKLCFCSEQRGTVTAARVTSHSGDVWIVLQKFVPVQRGAAPAGTELRGRGYHQGGPGSARRLVGGREGWRPRMVPLQLCPGPGGKDTYDDCLLESIQMLIGC